MTNVLPKSDGKINAVLSFLSTDPPLVAVDRLYLSHGGLLTLELVCSAPANPPASLAWHRLDTGALLPAVERDRWVAQQLRAKLTLC